MKVVDKKISELKPYEKNPRRNDHAVKYVQESIEKFGFKVPLVIDMENVIVAGHTRYKAAKNLNLESVPCVVADDLTEDQVKAFRLADNKVSEMASWDFDILNDELDDLFDWDMEAFGFYQHKDVVLDVDDDDFLQDTEVTKEKAPKKVTCPHCGEEFEV